MKKLPLEKYLKSDDETTETTTKKNDLFYIIKKALRKINYKIKKTKNKINVKTDELIILIKSNSSKHKQFLKQNEINDVRNHLDTLFKQKKTTLLLFF